MQYPLRGNPLFFAVAFQIFSHRADAGANAAGPVMLVFEIYMMPGTGRLIHFVKLLSLLGKNTGWDTFSGIVYSADTDFPPAWHLLQGARR